MYSEWRVHTCLNVQCDPIHCISIRLPSLPKSKHPTINSKWTKCIIWLAPWVGKVNRTLRRARMTERAYTAEHNQRLWCMSALRQPSRVMFYWHNNKIFYNNCRNSRTLILIHRKRTITWIIIHAMLMQRTKVDRLTICHCKSQVNVSFFLYVCPVIDSQFRHNIVKIVCGSTQLSLCG